MLGSLFFVKLSLVTDKHFVDIIRFFASLRSESSLRDH